jgi:pimeloyl-ACP methyl ester carboxylesterase
MHPFLTFLRGGGLFRPLFSVGGAAYGYTPQLPRDVLVARYGPPPSKFLSLASGARVHYRDQGPERGRALLLLHGSNASLHVWEPWVSLLSSSLLVFTVALPGHGLTGPVPGDDYSPDGMVKFLDAFRTELALARCSLGGNSMGGHVSWRYALAHPDVVEKLLLVNTSGINSLLSSHARAASGQRSLRTRSLDRVATIVTTRASAERALRGVFVDQRRVSQAMIDRYYDLLRHPGNRRASRLRSELPPNRGPVDRLGEIKVPTLIMSGREDRVVPVEAARLLHERIPGSRLI